MPIRANPTLPKGLRKKDKLFMIDIRLPDGTRYRQALGHSNRKLAEARLGEIRTEIAKEKFDPERASAKRRAALTFGEAWNKHFLPAQQQLKSLKETVRSGKIFLAYFKPETPLVDIKAVDIEAWRLKELERGLKVASVNRPLAVLRKCFNYLVALERLEKSPMVNLKLQDPKNERTRQATREEFIILAEEMKPEGFGPVAFAAHTGLRRGEMFPLEWEQIDFAERLIRLATSKNGRPREVPVSDACLELLQHLPSRLKSKWLFPNKTNTGSIDPNNFRARVFQKACKALKIKDLTWHDLRRTFACFLLQGNIPTRTIQLLLGHRDPRMVQRYAHQNQSGLLQAVNSIGALGGKSTDTSMDTAPATGTFGHSPEMKKPR